MTDDSQPRPYNPPPGQNPQHGQPQPPPPPPQYGRQPGSQPGWGPPPSPYGPPAGYGPPPGQGQSPYGPPPQYGQYGQQPPYPPRIDAKAVRPSLWWIALAWGIAVVCGVAGVVVFVTGVAGSVSDLVPTKTFASGETVTVPIDPANKPAVYVASDQAVNYQCEVSGGAKLAKTSGSQTVTAGSSVWEQILVINAPAKGDYQLTCTNQEGPTAVYGVGRELSSAAGGVAGGVVSLMVIAGIGVLIGIAGTVVVLVRRSGARKRLAVTG
ncbi:hypothetical protein ABZ897_13530 [Nonomuraea sp. NPDC046802]|uniref:hypothetical protein n=1 Tax=Nonomuraea sp. NPDC046802 TaxID=3154919 RepID=UPI0033E1CF64